MKQKQTITDLPMLLGPGLDISKLWVSSFTVDEYQAFAAIYWILGARIPDEIVSISFQRGGFRRAGQGAMPRAWLKPFDIPLEKPLPTYHPKLFLSKTSADYSCIISTGNIAKDDLFYTNNFAAQLNLLSKNAEFVARWIEKPPEGHRALCLLAKSDNQYASVIKSRSNASSLKQFLDQCHLCKSCRSDTPRGEWIVAAPFWSPEALIKMAKNDPEGIIEAYFRDESIWQQIACSVKQNQKHTGDLKRVKAFELINNGSTAKWHHKVIGWRCCNAKHANSLLYVGSANATACGFFGTSNGKTINWEAGAIWQGGNELWEYTRTIARAGFSAKKLSVPLNCQSLEINVNDEIGTYDQEEMERIFAAHLARYIRVKKNTHEIVMKANIQKKVRVLSHDWIIEEIGIRQDKKGQVKDEKLRPERVVKIKKDHHAQLYGIFQIEKNEDANMPRRFSTVIDLFELDPAPQITQPTRKDAISAALAGLLVGKDWGDGNGGDRKKRNRINHHNIQDVRFPFSGLFGLAAKNKKAAQAWLMRITQPGENIMKNLPPFWSQIASKIQEDMDGV